MREDLKWIDWWIKRWARWMASDRNEIETMCGFPKASLMFSSGGASTAESFDHMCEAGDSRIIEIVDACIGTLDGRHYAAICNEYLACVWSFRGDPATVLEESLVIVGEKARQRGVE